MRRVIGWTLICLGVMTGGAASETLHLWLAGGSVSFVLGIWLLWDRRKDVRELSLEEKKDLT